jgi:hypothetical protein
MVQRHTSVLFDTPKYISPEELGGQLNGQRGSGHYTDLVVPQRSRVARSWKVGVVPVHPRVVRPLISRS